MTSSTAMIGEDTPLGVTSSTAMVQEVTPPGLPSSMANAVVFLDWNFPWKVDQARLKWAAKNGRLAALLQQTAFGLPVAQFLKLRR